jgi:hypothetical protein
MKTLRLTSAVGIAATVLALAGCSQTTEGTPSTPGPSAATNAPGAQKVANPLDPSVYQQKPCDLLPKATPTQLGYAGAGMPDLASVGAKSGGPGCSWLQSGTGREIHVQVGIKGQNPGHPGVSATFEQQRRGLIAYAEPTEVGGYPAAFADVTDGRSHGRCALVTAVADDQVIGSSAQGYQGEQDSCDLAKQLAAAAIETLKGGG